MSAKEWGWRSLTPVAVLLLWQVATPWPSEAGNPLRPSGPSSRAAVPAPSLVGTGRCSAVACHGSAAPVAQSNVLRDEYTIWVTSDPHANAYQGLLSETSRAISRRLGRRTPPHRDGQCLACHSSASGNSRQEHLATIREDGVGCESCHGAAGAWLAPHTSDDWANWSPETRESRFGMIPLKDLRRRVERCATCHVGEPAGRGQPASEVDHDLIAAGHPRLDFEFSAFQALLPAHWREKGRNADADFPARAWAVGQAVSARSALRLLQGRAFAAAAEPTPSSSHWPEFSEYDCTSCHRELRGSLPRALVHSADGVGGSASWGSWYYPMAAFLADHSAVGDAGRSSAPLKRLRMTMEASLPAPTEVARHAGETERALASWIASLERETFDPRRTAGLLGAVRSSPPWASLPGWDEESQRFLALVPLRQASPLIVRQDARLLKELVDFRNRVSPNRRYGQP